MFPRIYANSTQKKLIVEGKGVWHKDEWQWKLEGRRTWFEWEKPSVEIFYENIHSWSLNPIVEDNWCGEGNMRLFIM